MIIVSIVMGFAGITFGLISTASARGMDVVKEDVNENKVEIKINRADITDLQRNQGVIENELGHIRDTVESIDKKFDMILKARDE